MTIWTISDAKANFSRLLRAASKVPQTITIRGEEVAVLLSPAEYRRLSASKKSPSFVEFMQASPLRGIDLKIERDGRPVRKIDS